MTEPGPAAQVGNAPADDPRVDGGTGGRRAARRGLATAALACVVGAGLALFAATRTWTTTTERQPPPLPAKLVDHTGASLIGWLPALALVGLAGAGALLATRGRVRRIIGVLLVLVGLGVVAGSIDGLDLAAGAWPVIVGLGGLGIAWAGLSAARSGSTWPAMGARYERPTRSAGSTAAHSDAAAEASMGDASAPAGSGPRPPSERATAAGPRARTPASMWDDLDRGVDPTDREA